jgi:hypothetical protein
MFIIGFGTLIASFERRRKSASGQRTRREFGDLFKPLLSVERSDFCDPKGLRRNSSFEGYPERGVRLQ